MAVDVTAWVALLADSSACKVRLRFNGRPSKPPEEAGISETGRQIALSHTGSMAGAPELYRALFDRLGIVSLALPDA